VFVTVNCNEYTHSPGHDGQAQIGELSDTRTSGAGLKRYGFDHRSVLSYLNTATETPKG